MSVFATWLQGEIDAKGWDQRQAALKIGVRESTVHNWLHQDKSPGVKNVLRIARALNKPVEVVLEQAGYVFDDDDVPPSGNEMAQRRADVLAALPQFAEIIDRLARQPAEKQAVYIELIHRLLLGLPPAGTG
jgi:transcriptional regulator with XRE-family HTH domain